MVVKKRAAVIKLTISRIWHVCCSAPAQHDEGSPVDEIELSESSPLAVTSVATTESTCSSLTPLLTMPSGRQPQESSLTPRLHVMPSPGRQPGEGSTSVASSRQQSVNSVTPSSASRSVEPETNTASVADQLHSIRQTEQRSRPAFAVKQPPPPPLLQRGKSTDSGVGVSSEFVCLF